MSFLGADQFAEVMGITDRAARKIYANALQGKPWRGETLPVVALPGQRGGKGGVVWGLALDKCSPALRAKLEAANPDLKAPLNAPVNRAFQPWQFEEQLSRLEVIRPILATDKRSTARDIAYRQAAAQPRVIAGQVGYHAEGTLRDWVRLYEAKGAAGLMPAQRKDRGEKRVLITREWDGGIDLPEADRAKIAQALNEKARSMIANDGTSNREVIRICERWLVCACLDAGSQFTRAQLGPICGLNQKWAGQFDHYRLLHTKTKDHKAWQDYAVPRIARALPDRPMDVLIGDVHYVDIAIAEGKEPVRARLIAWMDAASHFIWVTPVFLGKGQGVRQEDVAESLSQVALCPHGGIPMEYYLDNGSEYSALSSAMARLSVAADLQFGVTLAKPYAAQSKGLIEGCFNIIEGIFKGLPGWIGGDRTNKKSVRKVQVVAPYGKGLQALEADIRAAVAIYNDRPQRRAGRLGGLSPLQMLEAKIAASEFVARCPSDEVFDMVFSRQEVRAVRGSMITIENRTFEGSCLDTIMAGDKVEVLVPLRKDKGRAFIKHRGRDLGGCSSCRSSPIMTGAAQGSKANWRRARARQLPHWLRRSTPPSRPSRTRKPLWNGWFPMPRIPRSGRRQSTKPFCHGRNATLKQRKTNGFGRSMTSFSRRKIEGPATAIADPSLCNPNPKRITCWIHNTEGLSSRPALTQS